MLRRSLSLVIAVTCVASCGKDSPTGPSSPPAADTRIIAITGNFDFNDVEVGQSSERTVTVRNDGTAVLEISSLSIQNASNFAASWTSRSIPAGSSAPLTMRFTPTQVRSYDTTLRLNGNHTAGDNTRAVFGSGVPPAALWTQTGTGASVFDIPAYVTRIRIEGRYTGRCENFIVRVAGRLVVNVILGTCSVADSRNYDGTHLIAGGGVAEVTSASNINWTFTEVR